MSVFPVVGPSYTLRSVNFDCQRAVNLYLETSESGTSKTPAAFYGTPGLLERYQPAVAPTRGSHVAKGRCFFVVGSGFYELFSDYTSILRGMLATSTGAVQLADNGTQICAVDGPNGYIFDMTTNTATQIISSGWRGSYTVTYIDGYFVFVQPDTGIYYISSLNDGTMEDPLDFASAEGSPDNLVSAIALHRQLWLLGTNSVEIAFNSGNADFPFARIEGTFIQYGCSSAGSVAATANTLFWVGNDDDGSGVVWMAEGYQPQRISTYAIEFLIQQYDLDGCTSYTYQEDGHYFYILNIPSANTTLAYDIGLKQWHERAYFNLDTGEYERHRGQCHAYAFGKHLVGDYENGKIYQQALSIYDDNGNPKRWMRTCPHIADEGNNEQYITFHRVQLIMQTGVGIETGEIQDTNPEVMLRWSDDGGHAWSNEYWVSAGAVGEYNARALWRRLGRSRDRVFQFAGSSNTKVVIMGGNINPALGTN